MSTKSLLRKRERDSSEEVRTNIRRIKVMIWMGKRIGQGKRERDTWGLV